MWLFNHSVFVSPQFFETYHRWVFRSKMFASFYQNECEQNPWAKEKMRKGTIPNVFNFIFRFNFCCNTSVRPKLHRTTKKLKKHKLSSKLKIASFVFEAFKLHWRAEALLNFHQNFTRLKPQNYWTISTWYRKRIHSNYSVSINNSTDLICGYDAHCDKP